jgi:hypothetical protein
MNVRFAGESGRPKEFAGRPPLTDAVEKGLVILDEL